jgi:hypothetical protein
MNDIRAECFKLMKNQAMMAQGPLVAQVPLGLAEGRGTRGQRSQARDPADGKAAGRAQRAGEDKHLVVGCETRGEGDDVRLRATELVVWQRMAEDRDPHNQSLAVVVMRDLPDTDYTRGDTGRTLSSWRLPCAHGPAPGWICPT